MDGWLPICRKPFPRYDKIKKNKTLVKTEFIVSTKISPTGSTELNVRDSTVEHVPSFKATLRYQFESQV